MTPEFRFYQIYNKVWHRTFRPRHVLRWRVKEER